MLINKQPNDVYGGFWCLAPNLWPMIFVFRFIITRTPKNIGVSFYDDAKLLGFDIYKKDTIDTVCLMSY